jgi:hypothetical protein
VDNPVELWLLLPGYHLIDLHPVNLRSNGTPVLVSDFVFFFYQCTAHQSACVKSNVFRSPGGLQRRINLGKWRLYYVGNDPKASTNIHHQHLTAS